MALKRKVRQSVALYGLSGFCHSMLMIKMRSEDMTADSLRKVLGIEYELARQIVLGTGHFKKDVGTSLCQFLDIRPIEGLISLPSGEI